MQIASQHLETERMAAFDHDAPTPDELAHLASCAMCRAERQAYVALDSMAQRAASVPASAPRLIEWDQLAAGLRREGLLKSAPVDVPIIGEAHAQTVAASVPVTVSSGPAPLRDATLRDATPRDATPRDTTPRAIARMAMPLWIRAAAAVMLLAGGAVLGRLSTGMPLLTTDAVAATASGGSGTGTAPAGDNFQSVQQATDLLYSAQRDYERASLWLAGNDSTNHSSDVYRARLAALDQMMTASRAALRDAPQDPVLNHYFLTAYTAREATLKQLSAALPVDKTLERY